MEFRNRGEESLGAHHLNGHGLNARPQLDNQLVCLRGKLFVIVVDQDLFLHRDRGAVSERAEIIFLDLRTQRFRLHPTWSVALKHSAIGRPISVAFLIA
jgi:hypothetical protein